jgi:type VI secretion system protein ImpH
MFNHRLISLLYRVRKIHRVGMDIRSPERSDIAGYLRSIIGLGTAFLQGRMGVPDRSLLLYAGILSHHPRSMAGLERILGDYFQVRASGGQLRGTWRSLDESQQTVIGLGGKNNRLGQDTVLGKRFWDQSGSFTMELGPMGYSQFCEMLPGREGCHALHAITRLYTGDEYDCEITLLLRREEAPVVQLGSNNAARLGWTSWLASDGMAEGEALRVRLPNQ